MDTDNKNSPGNISESRGLFRSLKNVTIVYLIISVLTGRMSVFSSLCAGLLFVLPVVMKDTGKRSDRIVKSIIFGIPGVIGSIIFMLITGSYNANNWLFPALLGFSLCCAYSLAESKVSEKTALNAKSIILTAMLFVCFL